MSNDTLRGLCWQIGLFLLIIAHVKVWPAEMQRGRELKKILNDKMLTISISYLSASLRYIEVTNDGDSYLTEFLRRK